MIVGITTVRNEADIIETCLRHHLAEGVDHLIVADNLSTDGTDDIVTELRDEGLPITLVRDTEVAHNHGPKMTRLAEQARKMGADWVLPFDADEFFYTDHGTIADTLARVPGDVGVLHAAGWDHIATDDTGQPSPWRRAQPQRLPKVLFRAAEGITVHPGQHGVDHPLRAEIGPICYRHFQYRTSGQMVAKLRHGRTAADLSDDPPMAHAHWRELGALSDAELHAHWLMLQCESGLIFDPAPIRRDVSVAVVIPTLDPESEMCRAAVQAVKDTAPDAEVIVEHDTARAGFAETCNRGAARTDADVLVFLNDDTVVQPGWLPALVRRVGWGVVGGLLVYPNGQVQHSGVFLRRRAVLEAYNRTTPSPSGAVPAVTGACLAIGRTMWDQLDGFDTDYRNGYEDVDLCLRARQAGADVWFAADCRVVHLESQSPGRFDHAQHNIALLHQRWGHLI